jgi:hypothetical protein
MLQGSSLELFCTQSDLLSLFDLVEASSALTYAQTGLWEVAVAKLYASGRDLPNLGISILGETSTEASYLVLEAGQTANVEAVPQRNGGVLYAVDQMLNPDTVVLKPGGIYRHECVIAGQLAAISTSSASQALFVRFSRAIRQTFSKHRSYWIGVEAHDLWKNGMRLTIGATVPSQFDLREE